MINQQPGHQPQDRYHRYEERSQVYEQYIPRRSPTFNEVFKIVIMEHSYWMYDFQTMESKDCNDIYS